MFEVENTVADKVFTGKTASCEMEESERLNIYLFRPVTS